ncbi:transcriptional regulator [Pilimelia terevasa]|uniref:Transcriptional regulator n=1 Tax=Pilimelia terevasa TaxID=53372 RepID=A0A8J3BTE4_9ACTN|nr:helix-turn-helix transcriptional regulator [Pilimelia terevasa]GGK40526.1 transcriptional regulator [Pilimelia terevasa]
MRSSPVSAADEGRRALGARLRQLRKSAGLTGRALAAGIGVHFTWLSRIENGHVSPAERNIADWCAACQAENQVPDLLATLREVEDAYAEWQQRVRAGLRRAGGPRSVSIYEGTTLFRIHELNVIPGILQTADYTRSVLSFWREFFDAPDDLEQAVELRQRRAVLALSAPRRVVVVLSETAIRTRYNPEQQHEAQLVHLLSLVQQRPNLSLSVIPLATRTYGIASVGFWLFDSRAVLLETPTAEIRVTRPSEIRLYEKLFTRLQEQAAQGRDARRLITKAMDEL